MMFGTGSPKFSNTEETETVNLGYAQIEVDEPEDEDIIYKSPLTGHREKYEKGQHWVFQVVLNLFKYDNPKVKINEILNYKNQSVYLWRHSDGEAFKDSEGAKVEFIIESIQPFYLDTVYFRDKLRIKFLSKDYVDFQQVITADVNLEDLIQESEAGGVIEE